MWNEQIVFSELVIFLFYSWIVWHDRLFSVLVWWLCYSELAIYNTSCKMLWKFLGLF